ncbi:MAG: hydantoinase B/oxoprolinase family protein, partial [Candidatus Bathyarchaeia archaeon]
LRNSAYSPNIKERMDHSCAIFDSRQRLLAQAEHIPVHLGSLPLGVTQTLSAFSNVLEAGDMVIVNDPYLSGTHLPDITLISPVCYRGEIVAYSANKAHHSDIGGISPGSMSSDSSELCQEGLIIPPVKFVSRGKIVEDVSSLIARNVRTPEVSLADLRAQTAANYVGQRRVLETIERYGLETFESSCEEFLSYSERRQKSEIAKLPDGSYEAEDYLDDSGISNEPLKLKVKIEVGKSTLRFDYTGTDKQVKGPLNAVLGVTLSGVFYAVKSVTDYSIPTNEGSQRPIAVHVPPGTLLNPNPPAPVAAGNVETSQRNVDALLKAFSRVVPDKVPAASQGTMNNVTCGGVQAGRGWSLYETIAGGLGGRPSLDGIDGIQIHMTNTLNTPMEAIEVAFPILFESYQFRPDTGGPGKYRGGCGVERGWRAASSATASVVGDRQKFRPWGLANGKPGASGEYLLTRISGERERLHSKVTFPLSRGEGIVIRTPGGGGYGHPFERDPRSVLEDVIDGLVSVSNAKADYGVAIRPDCSLDWETTQELRSAKK